MLHCYIVLLILIKLFTILIFLTGCYLRHLLLNLKVLGSRQNSHLGHETGHEPRPLMPGFPNLALNFSHTSFLMPDSHLRTLTVTSHLGMTRPQSGRGPLSLVRPLF